MEKRLRRVRGIVLLPNLFTLGALFAGFYAIVASMKGNLIGGAVALLVALVLDGLDGRVARLTHTQTEFGAQLDSMSDMVCFGVTPALLLYNAGLGTLGKPGWLVAFIYTACTALRLARFNSQSQNENKRYFQGLATPAAAAWVALFLWMSAKYDFSPGVIGVVGLVAALTLSFLKVSSFRYRSFKDLDMRGRVSFMSILVVVIIFVLISFDPADVLLGLLTVYIFSGPFSTLWTIRQRRREKRQRLRKTEGD